MDDLSKNIEIVTGEITDYTSDGRGVLRVGGVVYFVTGGAGCGGVAIGDTVRATVKKRAKNFAEAEVSEIVKSSAVRVESDCAVFGRCGGCDFRNIDYQAQLEWKYKFVETSLKKIGGIEVLPGIRKGESAVIASNKRSGYRNHFQIPVRCLGGEIICGFFAKKSKEVVINGDCPMIPAEVRALLSELVCHISAAKLPVLSAEKPVRDYRKKPKKSGEGMEHIGIRISAYGEIVLIFVMDSKNRTSELPLFISRLRDSGFILRHGIISVYENYGETAAHTTYAKEWNLLFGEARWRERLFGKEFWLHPASFFQVNREQAERLYSLALGYAGVAVTKSLHSKSCAVGHSAAEGAESVPPANAACSADGEAVTDALEAERSAESVEKISVLDLYCGVGSIGLSAYENLKEIVGVEIVPDAVENARNNAALLGAVNARYYAGACESLLGDLLSDFEPDAVILDPPRGGADSSALEAVAAKSPKRIVYVSCNPVTLARDLKILISKGYEFQHFSVVDMFPMTVDVETVVLLSKGEIDSKRIRVEFPLDDMEITAFREKATYPQIKEYVLEQTGLKVSSLYISQIKRKCGLDVGESYNKPKSEDARVPQCPPEKEKAIMDALRHFGMIS